MLTAKVAEAKGKPVPWYPLFYRCNGTDIFPEGTILYPDLGRGRYFRNEILQAIAWCEKFPQVVIRFEFKGAQEFLPILKDWNDPTSYERPFVFVREMFDMRSKIVAETKAQVKAWKAKGEALCGPCPNDKKDAEKWNEKVEGLIGAKPYNILEKALKLILNSLYGKMAQSIGSKGEIPKASNPFYAGAITAGTRASLVEAGLHGPHQVVFFATDAIMSIGRLEGPETVEQKVLGEWEFAEKLDVRQAAIFVHPGIYSFFDCKGEDHTKTRGFKIDLARNFMMREIVRAWKAGDNAYIVRKNGKRELVPRGLLNGIKGGLKKGERIERENKLPMETTTFVTLGTAVSSRDNWKKCGSWKTQNRDMDLNSVGTKRMKCSNPERTSRLVFVEAASNGELDKLSAPYFPEWLDEDMLEEKEDRDIDFRFGDVEEN